VSWLRREPRSVKSLTVFTSPGRRQDGIGLRAVPINRILEPKPPLKLPLAPSRLVRGDKRRVEVDHDLRDGLAGRTGPGHLASGEFPAGQPRPVPCCARASRIFASIPGVLATASRTRQIVGVEATLPARPCSPC